MNIVKFLLRWVGYAFLTYLLALGFTALIDIFLELKGR